MKNFLLSVAIIHFMGLNLSSQSSDSIWFVTHYGKMERQIPMRDGTKLFTSVYYPLDNTENHPVLMERTPYSCAPYGENNLKTIWKSYLMAYLQEGYIMVIQDVRGRWMSEGRFADVRPFIPEKKIGQGYR
jgi:predicted acyl esterase